MEQKLYIPVKNQIVTFSALYKWAIGQLIMHIYYDDENGVEQIVSFNVNPWQGPEVNETFGSFKTGEITGTIKKVAIYHGHDSSFRVIAAKLELGDTQTLAHQDENGNWVLNEVPNYQEQLTRCQRYYQIFPSISTIPGGVAPTSSAPIKKEAFRPVMAKDITTSDYGTITIEGSTFYFADANL